MLHPHASPPQLAARRRELGLTRNDLGTLVGHKNGAYVARLERGELRPGFRLAVALELILEIPIRFLYGAEIGLIGRGIAKNADRLAQQYAADPRDNFEIKEKAKTLCRLTRLSGGDR